MRWGWCIGISNRRTSSWPAGERSWSPKIADLGIVATKDASNYTQTGFSLLTPFYAAPEQWRGTRAAELDGRTDLHALGGLHFQMLNGERVFDAENYEGWAYQHQRMEPRAPSNVRSELADWRGLDALVLSLLAKEPAGRPANVAEVLRLLSEIQYLRPVITRRTLQTAASSASISAPVPAPEIAAANVPRRVPNWVWAAGGVGLAAAAFAAGGFFRSNSANSAANIPPETPPTTTPQALKPASAPAPAVAAPAAPRESKPAKAPKQAPGRSTPAQQRNPPAPPPSPIEIKDQAEALYDKKS
jgi:serine/threonine protein kinase